MRSFTALHAAGASIVGARLMAAERPFDSTPDADLFPPTDAAVVTRLGTIRPAAYARTRNHLDGAVTRLSPYITHGFLTLRDVALAIAARHSLPVGHKLVYELGWRAWFRHAWAIRRDEIFTSLHAGPLPDAAYARTVPTDVRCASTGLPVIDCAVRTLYHTGWLHNHARMWLASYLVHLRKVHWRAGADWMYGHLLDGDLASNHLSWQWVAGTGSHKPYLFNAENVARYAPSDWHSPGTVLDSDYATLERRARSPAAIPGNHGRSRVEEPLPWHCPPQPEIEFAAGAPAITTPRPIAITGRPVWLIHPWSLRAPPDDLPPETVSIGWCDSAFHRRWSWSARRWQFIATRMVGLGVQAWFSDAESLGAALADAASVRCWADPHLGADLPRIVRLQHEAPLFPDPDRPCGSFSQYWQRVTRGMQTLEDLLTTQS